MLFVMLAIALAKAFIFLVTVTPAKLNPKIPITDMIPNTNIVGFYPIYFQYTDQPSIKDRPS